MASKKEKEMIAANELRIGNWVIKKENVQDRYIKITGVDIDYLERNPEDPTYHGIPITPEILDKSGAERISTLLFYEIDLNNNIGQLHINPDNGIIWLRHHRQENAGINIMTSNPYHLHQLQNLYFALTGTELQINL